MNRIKAIFFLLCFLVANSGIAVSAHWCGGRLTGIRFFSAHEECACGKMAIKMKPGCCEDKTATFQSEEDLSITSMLILKAPSADIIALIFPNESMAVASALLYTTPYFDRPPPGKPKEPRYLLNGVFRI